MESFFLKNMLEDTKYYNQAESIYFVEDTIIAFVMKTKVIKTNFCKKKSTKISTCWKLSVLHPFKSHRLHPSGFYFNGRRYKKS